MVATSSSAGTVPSAAEAPTIDHLVRRSVAERGDALALADAPNRAAFFGGEPHRLTWNELDRAVDSMASQLSDLGVTAQTAVAVQLPNVVELVVALLACARTGAIAVPFPVQHRGHELRSGLAVADVRVVLTADRPDRTDQVETMQAIAAEIGNIEVAEPATIDLVRAALAPVGTAPLSPDDVATICWTSGTTGLPKGVPRTHAMWRASSDYQVAELSITADDRILCPFPVVNMAGIGGMLLPWITAGAALFLHQPLDLQVFIGQIQGEKISYTVAPPPVLNMLLRNEALLASVDLSTIRAISSGSAPLDPWMVAGWQERGIEIVNVFGSNEGAALLSTMRSVPDPEERARFFPRPEREGVVVRLVDLDTAEEITETGRPGELRFSGPTVFSGYVGSTGEEFDAEGFYRTGDVFQWAGTAEPPDLLQFIDRAKDIIIRGGMNISAAEVEALVASHDTVTECAAVAYPDPDLGERVGLFVVAADGAEPTLDDLLMHLRGLEIASYKLPERIELVDALPRNPVGKITKADLRARWQPSA